MDCPRTYSKAVCDIHSIVILDENCNAVRIFGDENIIKLKMGCKENVSECRSNCPIQNFNDKDKTLSLIFVDEEIIVIPYYENKKFVIVRDFSGEIEEVLKRKDNILSNVSHELLTPIAVLKMLISELFDENVIDKEILEKIKSNISRLENTAKSLVDASKKNIIGIIKEPVNIIDIIDEALKNIEILSINKKISIHKDFEKDLPEIEGDRSKLVFLFVSLLSNAIKFNRDGGDVFIRVRHVHMGRKIFENGYIEVVIEDTGVGIPEDKLKYIFDPLYQVESKTTRRFPGVGMGLYMSKIIVDIHGGKIEIESILNKGTKVKVLLPVARKIDRRRI